MCKRKLSKLETKINGIILFILFFLALGIIGGIDMGQPLANVLYIPVIVVVALIIIARENGKTVSKK